MARRALTVEVDEKLLAAANTVAERTGVPAGELYERALRDVLARDFADLMKELAAGQGFMGEALDDDQGLALAYDELAAARADRRNTSS
jgi:hypothetical protein